jgi:flagellar hook-associated protein 3 FlgL
MRTSFNSFSNRLVDTLGGLAARQMRYQVQASTGQRIVSPEDDPAAMRRVLDLQDEGARVGQFQRNVTRLKELTTATYGVLRGLTRVSDRAGEIATRADGTRSAQELTALGHEVTQMIEQAATAANTTNRGDSLLGGTRTDRPPYAVTKGPDGRVLSVTFQGNSETTSMEISEGETVTANSVGSSPAGAGAPGVITDPRTGADFFNHLIELQNKLLSGDTAGIAATTRTALKADGDNLLLHLSGNATLQGRLEVAGASASGRSAAIEKQVSNESDADLAQTLVKLNETQLAYQAALQTSGKILSMSLLDYLH